MTGVERVVSGAGRVRVKVRRQDAADAPETRRWEEFSIERRPRMTIVSCLRRIQRQPVTADGRVVAPVAWESGCLDDSCGACTMLVNGRVRQACATRVDAVSPKGEPVVLEPLGKFPLVRDLVVDRARLFDSFKRVHAWTELDGLDALGPGPACSPARQRELLSLSGCIACAACLEACPQYGAQSDYLGAAALNQVRLMNLKPLGALNEVERLETVMAPGGVADCGKAQVCVEVCPANLPLVDSIQQVARATTRRLILGWLLR